MTLYFCCKVVRSIVKLWSNLLRQAWLVIVVSCIIGSVYTVFYRGQRKSDGSLSICWWLSSDINSIFGFAAVIIWPYCICGWISSKWAIALFTVCHFTDLAFRTAYWRMEHEYKMNDGSGTITLQTLDWFLATWALMNDLNSWILIPSLVYCLRHCCNGNRSRKPTDIELHAHLLEGKVLFNKDIDQLVAKKSTESECIECPSTGSTESAKNGSECSGHSQLEIPSPQNIRSMASSVTSIDLRADPSYSIPRRVSRVLQISIAFCILWFLSLDIYDYYAQLRLFQLRFFPLFFVFIGLAFDLQRSYRRQMICFHSLWYMIGYLLMEDLLSSWASLTLELVSNASDWFVLWGGTIGHVVAKMIAFLGYSASFQIIKRIARKFAIHSKQPDDSRMRHSNVQWDNFNSFDLQFLFMMYSEYFLFQFITQNDFDWCFMGTLILKMVWNAIKYHPSLRKKSRLFVDNPIQFWFSYIYGILISWTVLICQCCVYVADYYQPLATSKDGWLFGDRERTIHNLWTSIAMIGMVFCCDMTVYLLSYDAQRRNVNQWMEGIVVLNGNEDKGDGHYVGNKTLNEGDTGLGIFIPFHPWYYAFAAALAVIRCTATVLELLE